MDTGCQTPSGSDQMIAIPKELVEEIRQGIQEACGLLACLRTLKNGRKIKSDRDSAFYKTAAGRFKGIASELSVRFDTLSHFIPEKDLCDFARSFNCEWKKNERKLALP